MSRLPLAVLTVLLLVCSPLHAGEHDRALAQSETIQTQIALSAIQAQLEALREDVESAASAARIRQVQADQSARAAERASDAAADRAGAARVAQMKLETETRKWLAAVSAAQRAKAAEVRHKKAKHGLFNGF